MGDVGWRSTICSNVLNSLRLMISRITELISAFDPESDSFLFLY